MTYYRRLRTATLGLCLVLGFTPIARAQDVNGQGDVESTVSAPPNSRSMGSALGGAYFVDEQLLDRYESLKARLVQLRERISSGNTSGAAAMSSLTRIEQQLKGLRDELEKQKTFVSAFQVYAQTSEETFALGDERLVIITGDNVTVRGWDGPDLKCVVEKVIIAKRPPDPSEFEAIRVDHQLTVAADKVGLTRAERDQQERLFLESEEGRKLTDEQKAKRKLLVDRIHDSFDDYAAFQGREANTIQLSGLAYEDGNRNLTMRITASGGGGFMGTQWQRHATMTVFVPPCKSLAIRGCLSGLDVQDVVGDLVLTTHDSRDRQYDGLFSVQEVTGNVIVNQVPVRNMSKVTGNVRFTATSEFVNRGTVHMDDKRMYSTYETHLTRIDHVGGDLTANFLRTDLRLSEIAGRLDVVNQYGTTQLTLSTPRSNRAHRIVSQSGRIRVEGFNEILTATPIFAYTQCGRLQTNLPRDILDDVDFSSGHPQTNWRGFVTPSDDRFDFVRFERPAAALANRDRAAGLDLISHAGMVSVFSTPDAK